MTHDPTQQKGWSHYHPEFGAGDTILPRQQLPGEYTVIKPGEPFPPLVNPVRRSCYMAGSLKNANVQVHAMTLRQAFPEWEIFDDWQAAHPEADEEWQAYESARERTYQEALRCPAAQNVFLFDKTHLDLSTHGLLVLPAGKSAHLELGYLRGRNCATAILLTGDHDRWDVMYAFADIVTDNLMEVIEAWE